MDKVGHTELIALLHGIDGFSVLAPDVLEQMAAMSEYRMVPRGAALIHEGAAADSLYIVLRGRFTVLAAGRAIAEIGMGEPIGELAFFAGGVRTATVVAARDSSVMCLTRGAYDALAARTPALANGILAAVSRRLSRTVAASPVLRPQAGQVCAVFPAADLPLDPGFVDGVRAAFDGEPLWRVLEPAGCPEEVVGDRVALARWLDAQEAAHGKLVLLCVDTEAYPVWAQVTANNCDMVMLVMPKGATFGPGDAPSVFERGVFDATLSAHVQLVLHRDRSTDSTAGTARWLEGRPVGLHHHVALDSAADFARLGRFIRGEAVGLVMCGGGAFGTAHLGVVKSLLENDYAYDFVGGTSVGAAMGGALAIGLHPDDIMAQCEDIFIKSKAMSRLTVPRYSLLDHHRLDEAFKRHYGAFDVEDLPVNFFSIATNLTHNDVTVIRTGPLWQAVRASTAIPGVFPPFVRGDGEVLIDGGLIDNVPLTAMRDLKPGPNIVLNFMPGKPWTVRAKYEDLPNRVEALGALLRGPKKGAPRYPSAFAVLQRAMVVNARKLLRQIDFGSDVLLNISVLQGMSFMSWKRGRELFDAAYAQMAGVLAQTPDRGDPLERLRRAACEINTDIVEPDAARGAPQPRRSTITEPTE